MTKQDILNIVERSNADENVKQLVTTAVKNAHEVGYAEGFQAGMKAAVDVQNTVYNMLQKDRPA